MSTSLQSIIVYCLPWPVWFSVDTQLSGQLHIKGKYVNGNEPCYDLSIKVFSVCMKLRIRPDSVETLFGIYIKSMCPVYGFVMHWLKYISDR